MLRAALIGTGVALLCLVPPLLHFVTGPLAPFIGGAVAGANLRGRTDSTYALILMPALMAVMLGAAVAAIAGPAIFIVGLFIEAETQFSPSILPILAFLVAIYSFGLGVVGAMLGAAFKGHNASPAGEGETQRDKPAGAQLR